MLISKNQSTGNIQHRQATKGREQEQIQTSTNRKTQRKQDAIKGDEVFGNKLDKRK